MRIGIGATVACPRPSRPAEFHREPLTEPDLNLSSYPARATHGRLPSSSDTELLRLPLARISPGSLLSSLLGSYPEATLLRSSPPLTCASVLSALQDYRFVPFPFASQIKFSSSARKPRFESHPLYTGHRTASKEVACMLFPSPDTVGLVSGSCSSARVFAPRFFRAPPHGECCFTLAFC